MEKKINSFLTYLGSDPYYDGIYNSIFSWCTSHKGLLLERIDGYDVSYISNIDELELDYKEVWIENNEETKIDFDIAIELTASVEAVSGKHHDRDTYSSRLWVIVYCSGSIGKKLDDFKINGVDEFNKSSPKKPLSGDLVPYITKKRYDEFANHILDKYYFKFHPEAKTNPVSIKVDELANNMGLSVINTPISEDRSVFGQIFFADAVVDLYNVEKSLSEKRSIKKNTILVDEGAAYLRSFGSRNMTIAHECVHSFYHRKAFLFARMFNEKLRYIQCQVNGDMKNAESNSTAEWMEIQANGLAPFILMPKESFEPYAQKLFEQYSLFTGLGPDNINAIVDELAHTYEVTVYAARKRLIDLGFEQAIGAYNWVDNHYVRPYSFKKGSLANNETFTVSYKDVYKKVVSNPDFVVPVYSNQYTFVENHLCINHPKYIEKGDNGDKILSDYALTHMDECCVKFVFNIMKGLHDNSDFGLVCYLSRDTGKELEFDLEITNNPASAFSDPKFEDRYRIHKESVSVVLKAISSMSFGQIIDYLMKFLDIRIKELEVDSGLNERTIRRYTNNEIKDPDKRSVVALLRTLNLPPEICQVAVKQAGISFRNGDDEDEALFSVMQLVRGGSASDANRFMKSLGLDPLTKYE